MIPRKPGDLAEDEIYEKLEISEMLLGTTGQGEGCGFSEGHVRTALVVDPIALAASADKVKEGMRTFFTVVAVGKLCLFVIYTPHT